MFDPDEGDFFAEIDIDAALAEEEEINQYVDDLDYDFEDDFVEDKPTTDYPHRNELSDKSNASGLLSKLESDKSNAFGLSLQPEEAISSTYHAK